MGHGWKRWLDVAVATTVLAGGLASIFHRDHTTARQSSGRCNVHAPAGPSDMALLCSPMGAQAAVLIRRRHSRLQRRNPASPGLVPPDTITAGRAQCVKSAGNL